MSRVLVIYHSRTGHTESMANAIAETLRTEGLDAECRRVQDATPEDLLEVEGVILGSPTYYGTMAAEVKKLLDDSVKYHGRLDGKVGAAFSSAGSTGQETTVVSLLQALLIHGMIVQGDPQGHHYGVTTIGKLQEEDFQRCERFAQRYAALVKRTYAS